LHDSNDYRYDEFFEIKLTTGSAMNILNDDGCQSVHWLLLQDFHCSFPDISMQRISRLFLLRATMTGALANGPPPRLTALLQVWPLNVLMILDQKPGAQRM
jgi:hypothetical protein